MLKISDRFDTRFSKALSLLPDSDTKMRFMATVIALMGELVGDDVAIDCIEGGLAVSQGIGAAIVPQQQEKLFLVKR